MTFFYDLIKYFYCHMAGFCGVTFRSIEVVEIGRFDFVADYNRNYLTKKRLLSTSSTYKVTPNCIFENR